MLRDIEVFLTLLTSGVKPCITFVFSRNHKNVELRLVMVMNQPAARPSTSSYVRSQAKHFFFSTR